MSSAQGNGDDIRSDPMEMTPAPEDPPAFQEVNGVNGEQHHEGEEGPRPPPHRTPTSPSPQPEMPRVDAEACKAAGNKLYKAGQYAKGTLSSFGYGSATARLM